MRQIVILAGISFVCLCVAGCLVSSENTETQSGNYVAQSTVDQIVTNQTTKAWVQGVIGQPTSKVAVDGDNEVWKYSYSQDQTSSGAVFLIFGGENTKSTKHTLYIQFHGELVSSHWEG